MVRINADYIRFVHGDAARLGHVPAMRLIDMVRIDTDKDQLITIDLSDDDVRSELLTGAEAYSANAYSDRSLARTAQRLFQNIHSWEDQHSE